MIWWHERKLKSRDERKVEAAIRKLAATRDPRVFKPLVAVWRFRSRRLQRAVEEAITHLGSVAVDPLLAELEKALYRDLPTARIATILSRIGDARTVEPLAATFKSDTIHHECTHSRWPQDDLDELIAAFVRFGTDAIDPLVKRIRYVDLHKPFDDYVGTILREIGPAVVIKRLAKAPVGSLFRESACKALTLVGDVRAIPILVEWLRDANAGVYEQAGKALLALQWRPRSPSDHLHYAIAQGRYRDALALAPLDRRLVAALLKHGGVNSVSTLREAGRPAVKPLIDVLSHSDAGVRSTAAAALGALGDASAKQPIAQLLRDKLKFVRLSAIQALGKLGDVIEITELRATLRDADDTIRAEAACVLAQWGVVVGFQELLQLIRGRYGHSPSDDIRGPTPEMRDSLAKGLEQRAYLLPSETLLALASLDDGLQIHFEADSCGNDIAVGRSTIADCSQVRQLARQELVRRGYAV